MRITIRKPTRLSVIIREDIIKPLGLTVKQAAEYLGVTRKTLSALINREQSLSPEMAIRIGVATETTPESWLCMQRRLDLWKAYKNRPKNVRKFPFSHRLGFGVTGC